MIVEIKCVEAIHPVHQAQLLSYLRLSKRNVGLLINCHVAHLKDGIKRMVDGWNWERRENPFNHGVHRGTQRKVPKTISK